MSGLKPRDEAIKVSPNSDRLTGNSSFEEYALLLEGENSQGGEVFESECEIYVMEKQFLKKREVAYCEPFSLFAKI